MSRYKQKTKIIKWRKIKRSVYTKIVAIILFIIVVFSSIGVWGLYKKSQLAKEKRDEVKEELQLLVKRKESISEEILLLRTEHGVEERIRSDFGMVREGEEVVVLVDEIKNDKVAESEKQGIWKWLMSVFR